MKIPQLRKLIREVLKEAIYNAYDSRSKSHRTIGYPTNPKDSILWAWVHNRLEIKKGGSHEDHWRQIDNFFNGRFDPKRKELSINRPLSLRLSTKVKNLEVPPLLIQALKNHFGYNVTMYLF